MRRLFWSRVAITVTVTVPFVIRTLPTQGLERYFVRRLLAGPDEG